MKGFRDIGYTEGRDIVLEHRFPGEVPEKFRSMAAELVASKVDVLVAVGANTPPYAKEATIPVVFALVPDPLGSKLVKSLARPEANVTGLSNTAFDLIGKLEAVFTAMTAAGAQAVTFNPDGWAFTYRAIISKLALASGLPLSAYSRQTLEAGSLVSYGVDHDAICLRVVVYVDRLLKGTKPARSAVVREQHAFLRSRCGRCWAWESRRDRASTR